MGDPAGIGPEICLRALREPRVLERCTPVLFGDAAVLNRVARAAGIEGVKCRTAAAAPVLAKTAKAHRVRRRAGAGTAFSDRSP